MSSIVHFYHYTSDWGLEGIKSSGQINNSSQEKNHAHFGIGCYGTSLPPWEGKERIAQNNWRDHGVFYIRNGKVDWALDVKMPRHKARKVPWRNKRIHRDILVHNGPVHLDDYEWRALRVTEDYDPHGEYRNRSIPYTKPSINSDSSVLYSTDKIRYSFGGSPTSSDSTVRYSTDSHRHPLVSASSRPAVSPPAVKREETQPWRPAPVTTQAYRPPQPPVSVSRSYDAPRYEPAASKEKSSCTIL